MAFYVNLTDRTILRINGEDMKPFLQGIITNDIEKLTPANPLYAAILSPQGKYLFDFFLYADGDSILLDCHSAQKDDLLKKLKMYKLRSRVTIEESPLKVAVAWGDDVDEGGFTDPRDSKLGKRIVGTVTQNASEEDYDYLRTQLTVPATLKDLVSEKSFPLPCNMEEINAIDYKKGCYVGQEVTARSKHRGVIRKQLYTLKAASPVQGNVTLNSIVIGEVTSQVRDLCIAQLEKEKVEEARSAGSTFECNGTALSLQ